MAQILFQDYADTKNIVNALWQEVFGLSLDWDAFITDTTANGGPREDSSKKDTVTLFPNESTDPLVNPLNQNLRFKELGATQQNSTITAESINALYNLVELAKDEAYKGAGYKADKDAHYSTYHGSKHTSVKSSQYSGYDSYNSGKHSGWCTGRNTDRHSPRY